MHKQEWESYIKFLVETGKKVCCNDAADKPSEIMSPVQQETLTGHFVSISHPSVVNDSLDDANIAHLLGKYMVSGEDKDAKALLDSMKESVTKFYYNESCRLMHRHVVEDELSRHEERGERSVIDPDSGETNWM